MKRQYSQINELIGSKLIEINMFSRSAQKVLLITGATESGYRYLKQYPTGPARSYFQIETRTSYDIWQNYLRFRRSRRKKIVKACHLPDLWMKEIPEEQIHADYLMSNLYFAICMARLVYWRVPKPLPPEDDIAALGSYYIKYYNAGGKATIKKWQEGYDLVK